jgi:hypothetical protein
VLAGHLAPASSTTEVMLTADSARQLNARVGGHVTWQLYRQPMKNGIPTTASPVPAGRSTYQVAAIVALPPALADQYDNFGMAILPPAATQRYLHGEFEFGWVAFRLKRGGAGIPALQAQLARLTQRLLKQYGVTIGFLVRPLAIVQREAQQGIEPLALALAMLGGLVARATLVLTGQGLALILSRSARDAPALRALGATQAQAALSAACWGGLAILGAMALALGGAVAISPLAPIGPVRRFDPARGFQLDWLVLAGGGFVLLVLLAVLLGLLAWRPVAPARQVQPVGVSAVVTAARRSGLPAPVVTGLAYALERRAGRTRAPVRATLAGSVAAVTALVAALVFSASLTGLVSHPNRYGWNWSVLVQSQGGWGTWRPQVMSDLVRNQPGVTGWSEFGFGQLPVAGPGRPSQIRSASSRHRLSRPLS